MNKVKAAKGAKGEKGGDGAPSAAADDKTAAATKAALFIAEEELNNQLEVTGGCSKPKPTDVLVVQMCFVPWYAPSPFPFALGQAPRAESVLFESAC